MARPRLLPVAAIDLLGLVWLYPHWTLLSRTLLTANAVISTHGADAFVLPFARAVLWMCCLWLAVGLAALGGVGQHGLVGRSASAIAIRTAPRALRSFVLSGAGAGLAFAPLAGMVTAPATSPASAATITHATAATPHWPTSPAQAPPVRTPQRTPTPSAAVHTHGTVTVRPGDSLWRIAASQLGGHPSTAQIARAWPGWYSANRDVVGSDPGVIRPGEVLQVPTHTTTSDGTPR